jgi:hypothetical protein
MKEWRGGGVGRSYSLNLSQRPQYMTVMPSRFVHGETVTGTHLIRVRWVSDQNLLKKKNMFIPGIELWFFGYPTSRLVAILNELLNPTKKGNIFKSVGYVFRLLALYRPHQVSFG